MVRGIVVVGGGSVTPTVAWRIRYAFISLTFVLAAALYGLLVRDDWIYSGDCTEYCPTSGESYPWAWALFAIASLIAWLIVRIGRGVRLITTLLELGPGEFIAYVRRKLVLGLIIACAVVLVALAAQRVLQPDQGETFPFLALLAAGMAIFVGLIGGIAGVIEPLGHVEVIRPLSDLGRAAGHGAVPIAVVSATFILTIYSSEAWSALRVTPGYTIAMLFTILIGISVVVTEGQHRAAGSTRGPRRIAGRLVSPRDGHSARPTSRRWTVPILLGAASFIGFFVITVDLLQPESVLLIQDATVDANHAEYLATIAKIAALLAGLTTLVASESLRHSSSKSTSSSRAPR